MGAGASIKADSKTKEQIDEFRALPLDASDITTLQEARDEIIKYRKFASNHNPSHTEMAAIESSKRQRVALEIEMRARRGNFKYSEHVAKDSRHYEPKVVKKSEAIKSKLRGSMMKHFLFGELDAAALAEVVDVMAPIDKKRGENIITEGEFGDKFYVLLEGSVGVIIENDEKKELGAGENFGELALMYNCPRTATIVAKSDLCELYGLDRIAFKRSMAVIRERQLLARQRILGKVPILSHLNLNQQHRLTEVLVTQAYNDGDILVKQGQPGQCFYMIEEGRVAVVKDGKTVAELDSGQTFGESAFLESKPRNASVVALGRVKVLFINGDDFRRLFGSLTSVMTDMKDRQLKKEANEKKVISENTLMDVTLDDVEILQQVGKGGFGVVYLTRDVRDRQIYALKSMSKGVMVSIGNSACFDAISEKRLLQRLNHPFITKLHGALSDARCLYFLSEYCAGGDLYTRVVELEETEKKLMSEEVVRYIIACVLETLVYLHSLQIVYRDLKPENIVLAGSGACKMIDFTMAKEVKKRTFTVCGTPEYLAPEVILGRGYNHFADYWALGILVCDLLFGRTPFADTHDNQLVKTFKNILHKPFVCPQVFEDKPVSNLVSGLLAKTVVYRLGCLANGAQDICEHDWFESVDFRLLYEGLWPNCGFASNPLKTDVMDYDKMEPMMVDGQLFSPSDSEAPYKDTGASYEVAWAKEFTARNMTR
jgi:cGMP-dependent protein kinase